MEEELDPTVRSFLARMQACEAPDHRARERVRRSLLSSLAGTAGIGAATVAGVSRAASSLAAKGAAAAASTTAAAGSTATGWAGTLLAKAGVPLAVGAIAGTAMMAPVAYLTRSSPSAEAPAAQSAQTLAVSPRRITPPPPRVENVTDVPPVTSTRSVRAALPSAPPLRSDTLARETLLLERAQAELKAGRAEQSLVLLAQHERDYPAGLLREEAAAAKALAWCAAARPAEAQAAATEFHSRFPRSPLGPRVTSACAAKP